MTQASQELPLLLSFTLLVKGGEALRSPSIVPSRADMRWMGLRHGLAAQAGPCASSGLDSAAGGGLKEQLPSSEGAAKQRDRGSSFGKLVLCFD